MVKLNKSQLMLAIISTVFSSITALGSTDGNYGVAVLMLLTGITCYGFGIFSVEIAPET